MNKKTRVINQSLQPQMLDSGVQLPAAGTPAAKPTDVVLSERDRERLVDRGVVAVIEVEEAEAPQAVPAAEQPAAKRAPARKSD